MEQSASEKPLKPIGFTSDTFFVNRHPWILWVPAVVGLLLGTFVGGGALDSKNQPEISPTIRSIHSPSPSVAADKTAWVVYTNMVDQFYFAMPVGWNITEETSVYNTRLLSFFNDDKSHAQSISLTKVPNTQQLPIDQFVKKYYPDQTLLFSSLTVGKAEIPAKKITFSEDYRQCEPSTHVFAPYNNSMYDFSFTRCFDSHDTDAVFMHVLASITFMDNLSATPSQPLQSVSPSNVACTLEAKLCPDGSSVGRVGPRCEFAPCPALP